MSTLGSLSLLVVVAGLLAVLALRHRDYVRDRFTRYFTEPGSAFDLAAFRFLFYATALAALAIPPSQVRQFAALPASLVTPPTGFAWVVDVLPVSGTLITAAFAVLVLTSVTGALGLCTRTSSVVFVLAFFYYATIPQLYGKVNHYHIVIWVAVLLSVSRTADVWSLDALLRARRDGRRGLPAVPADSVAYSRPLRVVWLFLGLTYLLPGLAKYLKTGLDWAKPDSMRGILYAKWHELGDYRPPVPVDVDALLLIAGLGTILFEVTFIVWLFERRTRWISPVMGLAFHTMTNVVMRIGFYPSVALYVAFVPWARLGRRLFAERGALNLAYDETCEACATTATRIARVALPGAVSLVPARPGAASLIPAQRSAEPPVRAQRSAEALVPAHPGAGSPLPAHPGTTPSAPAHAGTTPSTPAHAGHEGLTVSDGAEVLTGRAAHRRLARRVPLLWPALPFLHTRAATPVATRPVPGGPGSSSTPTREVPPTRRRSSATAPLVVAGVVFVLSGAAAATSASKAWPVAIYPTFAGDHSAMVSTSLEMRIDDQPVDLRECFSWMPSERLSGLLRSVVERSDLERESAVHGLLRAAAPGCRLPLTSVVDVTVDQVTVSTVLDRAGEVVERRTIFASR